MLRSLTDKDECLFVRKVRRRNRLGSHEPFEHQPTNGEPGLRIIVGHILLHDPDGSFVITCGDCVTANFLPIGRCLGIDCVLAAEADREQEDDQ